MKSEPIQSIDQLAALYQQKETVDLLDTSDQTFGPNPCHRIRLLDPDANYQFFLCDSKRCSDCAPRKRLLVWFQTLNHFGDSAWVGMVEVNTVLERAKNRKTRNGVEFTYTALGKLMISEPKLDAGQNFEPLSEWRTEFLEAYQGNRIRRSRALGSVSLVSPYIQGKKAHKEKATETWVYAPWTVETKSDQERREKIESILEMLAEVGVTEREYLSGGEIHEYVRSKLDAIL